MTDETKEAFDDKDRIEGEVRALLEQRLEPQAVDLATRALDYATDKHAGQTRDDGHTPYIVHPMRVAQSLIAEFGITAPHLVAAAFLHDVLEDRPDIKSSDISAAFGPEVARAVDLLTKHKKDPNFSDETYIARIWHAGPALSAVKVADRLDNLRSLEWHEKRGKVGTYIIETKQLHIPLAEEVGPKAVARLETQVERLIATFNLNPAETDAVAFDLSAFL